MQLAILGLGVGLIVMLFRRRRTASAAPAGFARDNVSPINSARGFEQPRQRRVRRLWRRRGGSARPGGGGDL
jgi:hypothetical protein